MTRRPVSGTFHKYNETDGGDPGMTRCEWLVIGPPHGAVQYVEYRYAEDSAIVKILGSNRMAVDVGYHSTKPTHDGQDSYPCPVIEGACYYDGSGLHAEHVMELRDAQGDEALWDYLDAYFIEQFGGDQ